MPRPKKDLKPRTNGVRDPTLEDMKKFVRSVDWVEWWEEFYLKVGADGLSFYRTATQFANAKSRNFRQKRFLKWYLGAVIERDPMSEEYNWTVPQEWQKKRETGGWCAPETLELATREYKAKLNAIEKLNAVGDKFTIRIVNRIEYLMQELDKTFAGKLMVPGLKWDDNVSRAKVYLNLFKDLMGMHSEALAMQAKTLGIDFNNVEGSVQLFAMGQVMGQVSANVPQSQARQQAVAALEQLNSVMFDKVARFGMPLPDKVKGIIEATVEEVPATTRVKGKKDIQ